MLTRCFFDMRDICIAYQYNDLPPIFTIPMGLDHIVDGGDYVIPRGVMPIGLTAEQLWPHAVNLVQTFNTVA